MAVLISPMLAQNSKEPAKLLEKLHSDGDYTFDVKWDGVRCIAYLEDGTATLANRNDRDITFRYPDVVAALEAAWPTGKRTFDGELLAFNEVTGKPDFNRIARRDAQTSVGKVAKIATLIPVTYVIFDMLNFDGDDLRPSPLLARLGLLDVELAEAPVSPHYRRSIINPNGPFMWELITGWQLEGLIAKHLYSQYRGGRRADWVKLKPTQTVSCLVTGVEPGKGRRLGQIGALLLSMVDGDQLVEVGKVGTGFTDKMLDEVQSAIRVRRPHDGLLIVDVEFQNVTPDKRLRFPSFRGIRTDLKEDDCAISQLDD